MGSTHNESAEDNLSAELMQQLATVAKIVARNGPEIETSMVECNPHLSLILPHAPHSKAKQYYRYALEEELKCE